MVTANVSVYNTLASVWGTGPSDVWAAGSGGAILHYDGTQWTPTPTGRQNTLFGIWGSGPNDVWAVSSTDVLLHSAGFVGGTATWELAPSAIEAPIPAVVRAIWGSSPDSIRLGGRTFDLATSESGKGSQFVRAADGSWTALPGTFEVTSIWGAAADDVWMTADNGVVLPYQRALILHGTNGGGAGTGDDPLTWTPVESQANLVMDSIWGTSSSDVWTVGGLGTIRHFGNGDIRFQEVASPTRQDLHAVWGTGPDDVWAVGDAGTIIHWNGQAFDVSTAQFPIGRKPTLRGIWGSGRDDVWVVGDGIVLHYTGTKSGVTGGDK
jgi:hypothetical protein